VGNRAGLLDRLHLALARARRTDRRVAVLFCDLDGFKAVNDRFGHDVGDRMLVEVATRIREAVRPSDTVARTGGDEFVVVCDDLDDEEQAQAIADRVTEAVEGSPIRLGEVDLGVAISIGIALADAVLNHPDRLLHAADLAMYRAKEEGRGRAPGADR
jgi:diguanylate cyclase (GGDEF)-like protein